MLSKRAKMVVAAVIVAVITTVSGLSPTPEFGLVIAEVIDVLL